MHTDMQLDCAYRHAFVTGVIKTKGLSMLSGNIATWSLINQQLTLLPGDSIFEHSTGVCSPGFVVVIGVACALCLLVTLPLT